MDPAPRSGHVSLHSCVDPQLSGRGGGGAVDGGAGLFARAALPRLRRPDGDPSRVQMNVDVSKWSGEGAFTQVVIEYLRQIDAIALLRIEDAPASRSEADYNFVSNETYVAFAVTSRDERTLRFGFLPVSKTI